MKRAGRVIRLYLKSGQVIRFYASEVRMSKAFDGEYERIDGDNVRGQALKGFTPGSIVAWTTQKRRWWQW